MAGDGAGRGTPKLFLQAERRRRAFDSPASPGAELSRAGEEVRHIKARHRGGGDAADVEAHSMTDPRPTMKHAMFDAFSEILERELLK